MAKNKTGEQEVVEIHGSGSFDVPVVGEQSYLQNFEKVFGKRGREGVDVQCTALLIQEPTNRTDKNAVQVFIGQELVGYLERESAKNICDSLKRLGRSGIVIKVKANVRGGWYRSESDQGHFGVWLDFPSETLRK